MKQQIKRDFKGVWIPKEIWLDRKLSWMEKLILTEINSLDGQDGCYATNKYFADFFQLTSGRISQLMTSLTAKKYISVELVKKGNMIVKRVVRILNRGIKFSKEGYLENYEDNNTSINNTNKIYGDFFEKFWESYPKKEAKKVALKAFQKIKLDAGLFRLIMSALEQQKKIPRWIQNAGQYVPNAATWLNGERWHDEIKNTATKIDRIKSFADQESDYGITIES